MTNGHFGHSHYQVPLIEEEGKTRARIDERVFEAPPRQCPGVSVTQVGSGEPGRSTRTDWKDKISHEQTLTDKEKGTSSI